MKKLMILILLLVSFASLLAQDIDPARKAARSIGLAGIRGVCTGEYFYGPDRSLYAVILVRVGDPDRGFPIKRTRMAFIMKGIYGNAASIDDLVNGKFKRRIYELEGHILGVTRNREMLLIEPYYIKYLGRSSWKLE